MGKFGLAALVVIVLCVPLSAYRADLYLDYQTAMLTPCAGVSTDNVSITTLVNNATRTIAVPIPVGSGTGNFTLATFYVYPAFPYPINATSLTALLNVNKSVPDPKQTANVWANFTVMDKNGADIKSWNTYANEQAISTTVAQLSTANASPGNASLSQLDTIRIAVMIDVTLNTGDASYYLYYDNASTHAANYADSYVDFRYSKCGYAGSGAWAVSANTTCVNQTINVGGNLSFSDVNLLLNLINTTLNFTTTSNGESVTVGAKQYLSLRDIDGKAETTNDASNITAGDFSKRLKFYVGSGGYFTMSNSHVSGVGYAANDYTVRGLVIESQWANVTNSTITQSEYGLYLAYANYSNVTLTNVSSVSQAALHVENSTNVGASFNVLRGTQYGAYMRSVSDSNLTNNNMSYAVYGAYVTGNPVGGNLVAFNNLTGNSKHGVTLEALNWGGVLLATAPTNASYNNASYNTQNGIYVNESDTYANVQGNTVRGNMMHGIYLLESASNNVTSNNATDSSQAGYAGITLSGASTNCTVAGNIAWGNYYGIHLYNGANGNNVSYNNFSYNSQIGAFLNRSEADNNVQGNLLAGNTLTGISILSGWNNTLAGNNVSYNGKNGIVLNGTNHSVISATDVRSNVQKAVYASDGSWNNTFTGLTLFGTYGASYYDFYSQDYLTSTAFQNVTFNKSSVGFGACTDLKGACTSNLSLSWYANAQATFSNGTGMGAAAVTVTDAFGATSHSGTTNSSGWITPMNITEALFAGNDVASTVRNYTRHYFNASKTGYDYNGENVSIDSDAIIVTIVLSFCNHPASGVDWEISTTQPTECYNQSITLDEGNLTVPSGANLTLANVTLVFSRVGAVITPASLFRVKGGGQLLITDLDSNPATTNDETNVSNSSSVILFQAEAGSNVTIRNSEFSGVGYAAAYPFKEAGLWINATWANVTGNVIHHGYGGVYVVGANGTNVSYNAISSGNAAAGGIVINEANVSFVGWNNVSGTGYGLYAYNHSYNNTVTGNNLSYNSLDGMRLATTGSSLAYANVMTGNTRTGIVLRDSANATLFGNNATYNTLNGIGMSTANDTNCSYNNASYNAEYGIRAILQSNNTLLLNNTVLGNTGEGMLVNGSNYSRALYNLVSNGGDDGINFTSVLFGNASYNTINNQSAGNALYISESDNLSAAGNNASYASQGILIESSGTATVSQSTVRYYTSLGIGVNASTNATLLNNAVKDFAGTLSGSEYGVRVTDSPNATLFGSNSSGGYYGILISGSAYSNVSYSNASYAVFGITLQDSANSTVTNGTAFGNSKDGIRIGNVSYANVSLCTASNNSNNGVYVASSDFLNASYNYAQYDNGASYAGIFVTSSDNATLSYNSLLRNAIGLFSSDAGTANASYNDASYNSRQGIYLRASPHATLLGNNASYNNGTDADSAGIRVAITSTNASLRENVAHGNTQDGIGITDSENFTAFLNRATNNTRYGAYVGASANWNFSDNNVSYNGGGGYACAGGASAANASVAYNNASFNGGNGFRSDSETDSTYLQNTADNNTYAGFNVSNSTVYFDANNASYNGDGLLLYDDTATAYDNNTLAGNRGYGAVYVDSNVSINDSLVAANDVGKTLRAWTMAVTVTEKTFDGLSPSTGATVNVTNALFSGGIFDIYSYSSNLPSLTTNNGAVTPFILYETKTNSTTDYNPQTLRVIKTDCVTYGAYVSPTYKSSLSVIIGCAGGGGGGWVEPTPAPPAEKPKTPEPAPGAAASPTPSPTASATPAATPLPTPLPEEQNVLLCDESAQQILQTLREILVYENPDGSRWTLVRITLFNKGNEDMKGMEIAETLPANVTLADVQFTDTPPSSTEDGVLVWDIGTLGAGKSVTVTYIIKKQVNAGDFGSPTARSVPRQQATDWTQPLLAILALETGLGAAYYYFVASRKKKKKPIAPAARARKAT